MTEELFKELLEEGEGERVDFKEFNYDFSNSDKKIKDEARVSFIKDIFSFANTPKPYKKSAYILLGVKDDGELAGLKSSVDGNIFQQKLELKSLGKIPRIHYHKDFLYKEKIFGIIEIFPPESEKEPFIPESDFTEKIKKGVLYFRRDNKNSEASEIETINIKRWFYQYYERYEKNIQIPIGKELTNFPSLDLKNLVGRKQELKNLKKLLKQNTIVCITGISGQGKTTLARAYLSKNKNDYSNVIYLETDSSIQSAFLSSESLISNLKLRDEFAELSRSKKDLVTHLNLSLNEENKEKSHFELMMSKLRSLAGDNILVVDNINSSASTEIDILPKENWKILFTSKEGIENKEIKMYSLGTLMEIDSIELFKKHCDKEAKDADLKILLTIIDNHALLIELTAKAISKSLEINSLHNFLDKIKKDINDESLSYSFRIDHSKNQEVEFSEYIRQVFSISNLEKENSNAVYVLKMFLCFPSLFIEASEIMELLESGTLTKSQIGKSLRFLAEKGWLLNEKESFKMHPVIKLGINSQMQPTYEEHKKIIGILYDIVVDRKMANFAYAQLGLSLYKFKQDCNLEEKNNLLEVLYKSLEFLIRNGKYQESVEYADILLMNGYKIASTYSFLGDANSYLGKLEKAIEDYTKAIEIDPQNTETYHNRRAAYSDLGQLDKTIEIDPKYANAYINRGNIYSDLDQKEKAIEDYTRAIGISSKDAYVYINRGNAYAELNQKERAIEDYTIAIEIDSEYEQAYNYRGIVYWSLGQKKKAIENYTKATEINPEYTDAYINRGIAFSELDQKERAIEDYTRAIEIDSKDAHSYTYRGIIYSDLGQKERSIEDFMKAIDLDTNDSSGFFNRGNAYSELGDKEKAIEDYTKAIDLDPQFEDAFYYRGNEYFELGQIENAIDDYTKAIEINPKNAITYYNRGSSYLRLGEKEKAIEDYTKAIEMNPALSKVYLHRGNAYLRLGQIKKAIFDFNTVMEVNPSSIPSLRDVLESFFPRIKFPKWWKRKSK